MATSREKFFACAAGFFLLLLLVAGKALPWGMVVDDLNEVRHYSRYELVASLLDNWNLDGNQTEGLRPFSVVFDGMRYDLFGEHPAGQRFFQLALMAGYLALMAGLLPELGLGWGAGLIAALFCLSSRFTVWNYVYLTNGYHLIKDVWLILALYALLAYVRAGSRRGLALALLFWAFALLTREDALSGWAPLLLVCAAGARKPRAPWRRIAVFAGASGAFALLFMVYREKVVSMQPALRLFTGRSGVPFNWRSLRWGVISAFDLSGGRAFRPAGVVFVDGARALCLAAAALALANRRRVSLAIPALWLSCGLLACLHGLIVIREDSLLLPLTFAALFYGAVFGQLAELKGPLRWFALGSAAWIVAGGLWTSAAFVDNFHPASVLFSYEYTAWDMTRGRPTIPPERLVEVSKRLAPAGARSWKEVAERMPDLLREACAAKRRAPDGDAPFVARLPASYEWDEVAATWPSARVEDPCR